MNRQRFISGTLLLLPSATALAIWGVQYDPDLHYYTTGVLNPEVQHPPLYGLFIMLLWHLGLSATAVAGLQAILFTGGGLFVLESWPWKQPVRTGLALALGWGPVTLFYNLSLLSESLFLTLLLVALGAALRWAQAETRYVGVWILTLALALGLATLTRHLAWVYIGSALIGALVAYGGRLNWVGLRICVGVLLLCWVLQVAWHGSWLGGMASSGRLAWDNLSGMPTTSLQPETQLLLNQHHLNLLTGLPYEMRVIYGREKLDSLQKAELRAGLDPKDAHRKADALLGHLAQRVRQDLGYLPCQFAFIRENVRRAMCNNVLDYRTASFNESRLEADWHSADRLFQSLWSGERTPKTDPTQPTFWQIEPVWNGWTWAGLLSVLGFLFAGGRQPFQLLLRCTAGTLLTVFLLAGLPWQLRFAYPLFVLVVVGWALRFNEPPPSGDE